MSTSILEFLRVNGEKMDVEIAKALHMPMPQVQSELCQLSSAGDVICCNVTRFLGGQKTEGVSYRLAGTMSGKSLQPLAISKTR